MFPQFYGKILGEIKRHKNECVHGDGGPKGKKWVYKKRQWTERHAEGNVCGQKMQTKKKSTRRSTRKIEVM
jgi:hypothetical protein